MPYRKLKLPRIREKIKGRAIKDKCGCIVAYEGYIDPDDPVYIEER